MPELPDATIAVAAVVVLALVLAGPAWSDPQTLGDGSADARIVSPSWLATAGDDPHQLRTEPGRFGTDASYVRYPDVVVEVTNVTGAPELYYDVSIPAFERDPSPETRHVDGPGRYRLHLADVAVPPSTYAGDASVPDAGTYTGYVLVRVQSFSGSRVVANRTVEVVVDR